MKKIVAKIFFLFILLLSNKSFGQEDRWRLIAYDNESNGYIDKTSIVQDYDGHRLVTMCWVKTTFPSPQYDDIINKYKNDVLFYYYVDCNKKQIKIFQSIIHYTDNSAVEYENYDDYKNIVPESWAEDLYNYLCK